MKHEARIAEGRNAMTVMRHLILAHAESFPELDFDHFEIGAAVRNDLAAYLDAQVTDRTTSPVDGLLDLSHITEEDIEDIFCWGVPVKYVSDLEPDAVVLVTFSPPDRWRAGPVLSLMERW